MINIHNNRMDIVDYMDNDIPGAIHFYDDTITMYNTGSASTFSFTIDKFKDGKPNDRANSIQDSSYFSLQYNNEWMVFSIRKIVESDYKIKYECESAAMSMLNETISAYDSGENKHSIEEYLNILNIIQSTKIKIGLNEVSDVEATYKLSGEKTIIGTIYDLATTFGAEIGMKTNMYEDGTINNITIDIYKQASVSDPDLGRGENRTDVLLEFGRSLTGVEVTSNRESQYTAIRLKDKDGNYFKPKKNIILKHADGYHNEFYMMRNAITFYAPMAMMDYPSIMHTDECDNWTVREFKVDSTDPVYLQAYITTLIKKYAYPEKTYKISVDGYQVLSQNTINVGDYIYISDKNFVNGGLFRARVDKIIYSISDPSKNKIEVTNVIEVKSELSADIMSRYQEMINEAIGYDLSVQTDNGVAFKEATGQTNMYVNVSKSGEIQPTSEFQFVWYKDNIIVDDHIAGNRFLVSAKNMATDTAVYSCEVFKGDQYIGRVELTFYNVFDGHSPILTVIKSTHGTIFKNGVISTTLTATLWRNDEEIDKTGLAFQYMWTKTNSDGSTDEDWNNRHNKSTKTLVLSSSDVSSKAVFTCDIVK